MVQTYPIEQRDNKVQISDFSEANIGSQISDLVHDLPKVLAGLAITDFVNDILVAKNKNKPIIAMIGGHVIKCGLSKIIIELARRGFITALAMNGSAAIHDFEIAFLGATSESVEQYLVTGSFGMWEETGVMINDISAVAAQRNIGLGEALGVKLININAAYQPYSVLASFAKMGICTTVHVAIGTDIIHQHESADGAAIGKASMTDFHRFVSEINHLSDGGVVINFGSAVIMPEVFLKAMNMARNINPKFGNFVTANFDMISQYRAFQNVVIRPKLLGARTYNFIGHHEIMIPLLSYLLTNMN